MKNNLDLILNGPVLKMICKLSLPNSITGISMVLIVISDAYFVSKLGNVSLASLALVFPFITLMQMMSAGAIGGASTSSISRFLGANLIDSAPGNLNTLNELAAAMNDNASFFSTVLPLSGGTMTGDISHASNFRLDVGGVLFLDGGTRVTLTLFRFVQS